MGFLIDAVAIRFRELVFGLMIGRIVHKMIIWLRFLTSAYSTTIVAANRLFLREFAGKPSIVDGDVDSQA
jgi:hypothetical protein